MPTRYLKAGIRDSELIDSLSPLAETFYYRLLVTVDDFGRFDARPAMIKAQCFPIKESVTVKNCSNMLKELADFGLIDIYEVDGKSVLQVCKWDNVPRTKESKYPNKSTDASILHTDVCKIPALVPLTETETETKTETKTVTGGKKAQALCVPVSILVDNGFDVLTAEEFIAHKSRMKAPLTARAWADHLAESAKAGWRPLAAAEKVMAKSWKGFEAKYVVNEVKPNAYTPPSPAITTPSREAVDPLMSKAIQESTRTFKPVAEIHARLRREQRIAA